MQHANHIPTATIITCSHFKPLVLLLYRMNNKPTQLNCVSVHKQVWIDYWKYSLCNIFHLDVAHVEKLVTASWIYENLDMIYGCVALEFLTKHFNVSQENINQLHDKPKQLNTIAVPIELLLTAKNTTHIICSNDVFKLIM